MTPVDLSVVVCTLNRSKLLSKCLDSLAQQERGSFSIEVIVVDNGSTDDTKAVAESFQSRLENLRYIFERRLGLAQARQSGFKASAGRYIGYLDDDAVASPGWCAAVCDAFGRSDRSPTERIAALGGPIEPLFEIQRPSWLTGELATLYAIVDLGDKPHLYPATGCPVGANMAFLRSALQNHPWDERLLMCEEIHLFARLKKHGSSFLYVPEMRVQHFISAKRLTREWLLRRHFDEGIANRHVADGIQRKLRRLIASTLRLPYAWSHSHFGPDQERLAYRCKTMLYAGTLAGLLTFRDTNKTTYISDKHQLTS